MTQKRYLAIDFGGTSAKYGIVTTDGQIDQKGSFATGLNTSEQTFLKNLLSVTDRAVADGVSGIGVSSLGFIDSESGKYVGGLENLPYVAQLNFKDLFGQRYDGIRVAVKNDGTAAALGEHRFGAARGCDNFFCITIGTGMGGALVLNGKPVGGEHHRAAEIGYLYYRNENDYFESAVSAKWMIKQAADKLKMPDLDGIRFFDRVRDHDPVCVEVLHSQLEKIARCVADIIIVLDVEKVVIGGGVSGAKDVLIPLLEEKVEQMLPVGFRGQCQIVAAQRTNDAGLLGAVCDMMDF